MQKRAGTENVAGIVAAGVALEAASRDIAARSSRVRRLHDLLRDGILASVPGSAANGCQEDCLPNNLNIAFKGVESDLLVAALDAKGIAVSSGSACSNSTWEPSHVLMAMGVPIRQAAGSIRFSLGESTAEGEIRRVLKVLPAEVERLRAIESREH
jgi:cysteine desulfurase